MGLLEILGIRKKENIKNDSGQDQVLEGLQRIKEKFVPLDGEKYIGVPMQRYVGGIKENPNGALITHGNNFREMDLEPGNYVKLKGYRGHFLIDQNQEAWDGLYRLRLIRRNPPKDYSREIVILNNYAEATD